jgi:hypothetical protein
MQHQVQAIDLRHAKKEEALGLFKSAYDAALLEYDTKLRKLEPFLNGDPPLNLGKKNRKPSTREEVTNDCTRHDGSSSSPGCRKGYEYRGTT